MKRFLIAIALASATFTTAACERFPQAATVSAAADKAIYTAEALYNVPAQAYVVADSRNQIPDGVKASIKPKLVSLYDLLKKARAAKAVGDSINLDLIVAAMRPLSNEVQALIPA